jgi:LPXTG-motif cell wall-anchored protein
MSRQQRVGRATRGLARAAVAGAVAVLLWPAAVHAQEPTPPADDATDVAAPAVVAADLETVAPAQEDPGEEPVEDTGEGEGEPPAEEPVVQPEDPEDPEGEGGCRAVNDGTPAQGCEGEPICTLEADGTETCVLGTQVVNTGAGSGASTAAPEGRELAQTGASATVALTAVAAALVAAGLVMVRGARRL